MLYAVDTRSNSTLADSEWLSLEETLHEEGDVAVATVETRATEAGVR